MALCPYDQDDHPDPDPQQGKRRAAALRYAISYLERNRHGVTSRGEHNDTITTLKEMV